MPDLTTEFAGVVSPNPFWLASAPPTNMGSMVSRAFDQGWGGAVWKTLGDPIVNVSSRLAASDYGPLRMMALNNIELITDRSVETNLREIAEVKKAWPDRAVIVSVMVNPEREAWHEMVERVGDTGADGVELNFGCPHGMSERGMGSAIGQVPEYTKMITEWVAEKAADVKKDRPFAVIVKLTPNVTDVVHIARAAREGGADAVALINTINSIMSVDLDTMVPAPNVNGKAAHGGLCGPAVKPIALHMVSSIARDPGWDLPISGIGGIADWRDAAEFLALGATNVQVCTAVMHFGYRIVEEMTEGLEDYLTEKGLASVSEMVGAANGQVVDWGDLDLGYQIVARVHPEKCIRCNLCHVACRDGAHQSIELVSAETGAIVRDRQGVGEEPAPDARVYPRVVDDECVGCNLCSLVCPEPGAITMERVDDGSRSITWREWTERGLPVVPKP
ncbi:MAG: NAD-dependent dihydropyrimidine dehydrogenase subunit PreA [Gemmatimonadota bacterium]|nr:NAD-dependent dihydropyrimidine dehydrogenase subunit PreA [Gemmatimonadota bacterium]MDP6529676.1 NAD-dependent dihydropyrimidine dehydrogenase subunit PreA [Gemmatimonadota bacterium]MDP6802463.1 NAD-dependent dihydropyrimidine dehydrogenase subunit PreA [Gemmatimonadota bacterium]MDP7030981.1 NAD-dependent dihydropyrimidine dehydrogenase subunit PreA [Gemmatimonadota bacterium]